MEIERKFLVDGLDKIGFDIEKYPKKHFVQAYISTNPTIRLRDEDGSYILCLKSGGGLARDESELEIGKALFDKLWGVTETEAVHKNRYFIPLAGSLTAELDIYLQKLEGLVTVEVEFDTVEDAEKFTPPEWFGKDVTSDYRYKNSSLAVHGLPERR